MLWPDPAPRRALSQKHGWGAFGALVLLLAGGSDALAQVAPGGLGTRVNGTALGRCSAGVCTVEGGTAAGRTLFHRFSQYDTRSGIRRVDLDTRGRPNVVVGVGHPDGSFFGAPLKLNRAANLFWLSPGGLWFGAGGQIQGATNLLLTTAPTLRIGGGTFAAAGGLGDRLEGLGTDPPLDLEGLARRGLDGSALGTGDGPIVLAGGRLSVDRHLLLHSGAGPIQSAPGERMVLEAGRSVQLSGGNLQLRGLDLQAGTTAAEDLVRLRSGPLVGGGFGSLELADARLRGTRVLLEGSGGLALERVEARAGRDFTAAGGDVRLAHVSLRGTDVVLQARATLMANQLRVNAATEGPGGQLALEAGGSPPGAPALRLEETDLTGRTIQLTANGPVAMERVQAEAGSETAPGEIGISARSGATSSPSELSLRNVTLTSSGLALVAAGDLRSEKLTALAKNHWLQAGSGAQDGVGNLNLANTVLSGLPSGENPQPAQLVKAQANGDLSASHLSANGNTVLLQASGTLSLQDNSLLMAPETLGQIRLEAVTAGEGAKRGSLRLQTSQLRGESIVARADRTLLLEGSHLQAGSQGHWGLVRLETAPAEDPPQGTGPGSSGNAQVLESTLAGQWVLLRSGTVAMKHSRIESPKGMIHIEAKTGDMTLSNSVLDVGTHTLKDLLTEITMRDQSLGISIDSTPLPPSIGLFAAGNLDISKGSHISASQNIQTLRTSNPHITRNQIRLNDTSGLVIATAGEGLSLREGSRIEADASDNLAGIIALQAQATHQQGQLTIQNSTISTSGGAGSGDIRLHSNNGIQIEANSLLKATSHNRPENQRENGKVDWFGNATFSGGEITLTNSSQQEGIIIRDSRLLAEQSSSGELLSTLVLDGRGQGRRPKSLSDVFDTSDRGLSSVGGIVNLISTGGLSLTGPDTLVSVDSRSLDGQELQSLGGTIRIVNFSDAPIQQQDGAQFSFATSHTPTSGAPARSGELVLLAPAPIPLPEEVNWGLEREPNPYLLQAGAESVDAIVTGGENFPDHPNGLPGIIRDRINPTILDQVYEEGSPPRPLPALPSPASGPVEGSQEEQALDQAGRRLAEGLWIPMTPVVDVLSPLTTSLSLGLASPEPIALASSMVEVRQEMPEAAARQSFQTSEQEAARDVSAALGLTPPQTPKLEISSLQLHLRTAFPQESAHQKPERQISVPAILQITSEHIPASDRLQINHILIPATGEIRGWQTVVPASPWRQSVKTFQQSLSQQSRLDGAGERLSAVLLDPVLPELRRLGVTTLLLSLDRGLQGVPFAALPANGRSLIEQIAITITPSLTLTDLQTKAQATAKPRTILAGASHFSHGLMPLPMVQEELRQVASLHPEATVLMDTTFNNENLLLQIQNQPISILHLATHAEFSKNRSESAVIYTSSDQISLQDLGRALRARDVAPLSLFVLNACRTAVGDEDQELGIAGLALQAGASSALGNLWLVDDVASAAFSVQFHRAIQSGLPSDQALQLTQQQFRSGQIKVRQDQIINGKGDILLTGLSRADQARLRQNLDHPYFWAGAILSGKSW